MKKETKINKFGIAQEWVNMSIEEMKSNTTVNETSFFECTVANWKTTSVDFKADYISESGSQYMYASDGVYRKSNHWFYSVSTCVWVLDGKESVEETIAFCKWEDFKQYSTFKSDWKSTGENIKKMLRGEMVLAHRIGKII